MMTVFVSGAGHSRSYREALTADTSMYAKYFRYSLENGIYLAPSQFESMFVSYAHTREDLEKVLAGNLEALTKLKEH